LLLWKEPTCDPQVSRVLYLDMANQAPHSDAFAVAEGETESSLQRQQVRHQLDLDTSRNDSQRN
jgi:hypothetical protein